MVRKLFIFCLWDLLNAHGSFGYSSLLFFFQILLPYFWMYIAIRVIKLFINGLSVAGFCIRSRDAESLFFFGCHTLNIIYLFVEFVVEFFVWRDPIFLSFFSLSLIPWRMAFFFTKKNIIMALFFIPSLPITTVTRPPTRPDPLYNHLHYHHYYYYNSTTTTTTTTTTSSTSPITNKPFYHTPFSMSEHKQISGVLQKPKSNGRRRKVRNKPQTTQTQ